MSKHTHNTVLDRVSCDRTSILARLMATENIIVEHMPDADTASFCPVSRRLVLPVWSGMDTDIYDMLVGHEVGHALYTPCSGWHSPEVKAIDPDRHDVVMSYLNIVEDARIERLMKRKYPGLVHNFRRAYIGLYQQDRFNTNGVDLTQLPLIDRLNLRAKVGLHVHAEVPIALEDEAWYTEMMLTETWDDVVDLTRRLYQHCRTSQQTQPQPQPQPGANFDPNEVNDHTLADGGTATVTNGQGAAVDPNVNGTSVLDRSARDPNQSSSNSNSASGAGTGNGTTTNTSVSDAPSASTNVALGKSLRDMQTRSNGINYVNLPVNINWQKFVVDYKNVLADFDTVMLRDNAYNEWRASSIKYINMLVKEFELRKAADISARTTISRTGVLDVNRLHQHRFIDNIFRKMSTVREGKNHGMVMFLDWSSSMDNVISSTMRQVMTLAAFCRRMNIPFEVYAFSNHHPPAENNTLAEGGDSDAYLTHFQLFNLLSSRMNTTEFVRAMKVAVTLGDSSGRCHSRYRLNGTPLHQTMLAARYVVEDFRERTQVQIVNTIFLTDGEDSETIGSRKCSAYGQTTVYRDMRTRAQVLSGTPDNPYMSPAPALLRMLASTTGSRVIGMYLVGERGGKSRLASMAGVDHGSHQHEELVAHFRTHRFVEIKNQGYDSYFVIPSDKLDTAMNERDEFMQKQYKTRNGVARSFASSVTARAVNRVLLGRFVDLISR